MSYRNFARPAFSRATHTTADWLDWLSTENVLHSFAPRPQTSCQLCGGPVGTDWLGQPYRRCFDCNNYGDALDDLVPISYSLDAGLESILHRYKDFTGYRWLGNCLGALLYTFLVRHLPCIEREFGKVDTAVLVPSDDEARMFNHLWGAVATVPALTGMLPWKLDLVERNPDHPRPRRKCKMPESYSVESDAVLWEHVLVFDDTWTSGASMVSVAQALKDAGADRVTGLTLGRQINRDSTYLNNQELLAEIEAREWEDHCVADSP